MSALQQAADAIRDGLKAVRSANAENGRKQAQLDALASRAEDRTIVLKAMVSDSEDADLGQVASELAQRQATLQASYSTFAQLSKLSLADYLR
jgi:flagellar hook-associated protein 3 FlgL